MSELITRGRFAVAAVVAAALAVAGPVASANAQDGGGRWGGGNEDVNPDGGADNRHLMAEIGIQVSVDGAPPDGDGGQLAAQDPDWEPPACWYEPAYTPDELADLVDLVRLMPFVGSAIASIFDAFYDNEDGPYHDYHREHQGEGVFYTKVVNPDREDDPEAQECDRLPFFVEFDEEPDDPLAVSPQIMAEYAYERIPIPGTAFQMSPSDEQTVNLATWLWSDAGHFQPVSAIATLPGTAYEVTTTATPASLRIDPGTEHADAHGDCAIDLGSGTFGREWTEADGDDPPPCGVTYRKASAAEGGPYALSATLTWEVEWTDNLTGEVRPLPDGAFETTVPVTVAEVQTIVR